MFPIELVEAVEYLNQIQIVLCTLHTDGRRNSREDEDIIIKLLQDKFGKENIIDGDDRYWWDVKIFGYYVNIKTSDFTKKASDNISSFAGILYAFTQISADKISKHPKSQQFLNAMQGTRDVDNNRDYYLLVVDKSTTKVYLSSVKALAKITANGCRSDGINGNGYNWCSTGGGSGGGAIRIFYKGLLQNSGSITADGGVAGTWTNGGNGQYCTNGGDGGAGTVVTAACL